MTVLKRPVGAVPSSNVAIWAASGFVAFSAALSLMPERDVGAAVRDWALRGTIAPSAFAAPTPSPPTVGSRRSQPAA